MSPRLNPLPNQTLATRATATQIPTIAVIVVAASLVNNRLTQISWVLPLAMQEILPMSRQVLRPQRRKTPSTSDQTQILITHTTLGPASVTKPIAPKANVTRSSIRSVIHSPPQYSHFTLVGAPAHQRRPGVLTALDTSALACSALLALKP